MYAIAVNGSNNTNNRGEQEESRGCEVELSQCDLTSRCGEVFNEQEPSGTYALDMTDPYHRMIMSELLRLAMYTPGCHFKSLVHRPSGVPHSGIYSQLFFCY